VVGLTPKVLLAALLLPSFMAPLLSGAAETYSWSWIAPIVARDLIGSFVICAGWEHILYSSTLAPKLAKYKMNLKMPRNYNEQIAHDQVFTFFCVLCASAVEVWALHTYAIGGFGTTWRDGFWGAGAIFNVLWVATTTYWRLTHFWFIHRGMHPWFKKGSAVGKYFPDIGKLMYTHVHKLHHYSYNPTTWSGLSMHPVEGTIYFTAALIPALLGGAHPYLFILCKLCLSIDSVRCYSRERHSVYHPGPRVPHTTCFSFVLSLCSGSPTMVSARPRRGSTSISSTTPITTVIMVTLSFLLTGSLAPSWPRRRSGEAAVREREREREAAVAEAAMQ
jgi:hypothetical protein